MRGRAPSAVALATAALVAVALVLCGCSAIGTGAAGGAGTGSPGKGPPSGAAAVARAETTHEYPAAIPPAERAPGGPSAEQVILAFAGAYINWTAPTVARRLQALAAASVGQARAAMQLAAAQTAGDYELHRGGIANHGTVQAIAPLRGTPGSYVVVTREATTASDTAAYQGLRPAWHVTVAGVRRLRGGGWVVDRWQPEG